MEKLSNRILNDLENTLVSLDGNLRAIDNGTHIKIPTGAGYVSFYKSLKSSKITLYLTETQEEEINLYDGYEVDSNTSKSDKL